MLRRFSILFSLLTLFGSVASAQQEDVAEAIQKGPASSSIGKISQVARSIRAPRDELLADLARSQGLAAEHLAWANGLAPTSSVSKGDTLRIPSRIRPANPPHDGAVVNLAERGLYLFKNGEFEGFYPLAIGRNDKKEYRTPTGTYSVASRIKNPDWVAPDSEWAKAMEKDRISGDSEDNPLGEYWFGIDHPAGGYGFHENLNPDYTGDTVSHGCMRLNPEHARKLYDEKLLTPGMSVRIENNPFPVGRTPEGQLMLAVFPSTYGKSQGLDALSQRVQELQLGSELSSEKLRDLTASADGIPRKI